MMMKNALLICFAATVALAGDIVTVDKDGKVTTRQETPAEEAARKARKSDEPPSTSGLQLADQVATLASNQIRIADALRKSVPATTNDLATIPTAIKPAVK